MSTFYRTRYRVELEGREPIEVVSSARDSIDIVLPLGKDGKPEFSMGMIPKIVHNALVRTEAPGVPRHFGQFLDILIDATEIDDGPAEDGAEALDPTQSALSGG